MHCRPLLIHTRMRLLNRSSCNRIGKHFMLKQRYYTRINNTATSSNPHRSNDTGAQRMQRHAICLAAPLGRSKRIWRLREQGELSMHYIFEKEWCECSYITRASCIRQKKYILCRDKWTTGNSDTPGCLRILQSSNLLRKNMKVHIEVHFLRQSY